MSPKELVKNHEEPEVCRGLGAHTACGSTRAAVGGEAPHELHRAITVTMVIGTWWIFHCQRQRETDQNARHATA